MGLFGGIFGRKKRAEQLRQKEARKEQLKEELKEERQQRAEYEAAKLSEAEAKAEEAAKEAEASEDEVAMEEFCKPEIPQDVYLDIEREADAILRDIKDKAEEDPEPEKAAEEAEESEEPEEVVEEESEEITGEPETEETEEEPEKEEITGEPEAEETEEEPEEEEITEEPEAEETEEEPETEKTIEGSEEIMKETKKEIATVEMPEEPEEESVLVKPKNSQKKNHKRAYTFYDNRELSWLKFDTRVLEEAEDAKNPFCERLSFASIFQSNLDEFFMVRVGSLYDTMLLDGEIRDNKTNMTCKEQLQAIFEQVKLLTQRKDAAYKELENGLRDYGVDICRDFSKMSEQDKTFLELYFENEVRTLLAPQVVGKKQPFPFLKNKQIYAVVVLGKKGSEKLGIVPCTVDALPRMIRIPDHENKYILMEDLILHYIGKIFDRFEIQSKSLIRIIRNADIDPDEEMYDNDTDFRQVMERLVSRRRKLAPIKLEYTRLMDDSVIATLCKYLDLKKKHVFHSESPLDLSFFSKVRDLLRARKDLFYDKFSPQMPLGFDMSRSIMEQVEEKDRFLFFPYDNIEPFLTMLNEAAADPEVVSMKMTLYRVANDSKVVDALIRAAENGKNIDVLVELRARFDEENNIGWSRRLEDAGCHILYGLDKLKVHSKLCLITKKTDSGISYITQIGTGNYNEKTAKLYTDFSLMTANQEIGAEADEVFRRLYLGQVMEETHHLMVAPKCLRNKILDKIDIQIAKALNGEPAYVGAKMNSLTDKRIIEKLIEASRAGVKVELVVRGACCLIAGIPGATENITVRSIVGRYLEHSRIYIFGDDDVYIASADFMTRNTTRRVEVATPIYDKEIKARVLKIFHIILSDNVKARVQLADGDYVHVVNDEAPLNAQEYFQTQENR